MRKIRRNKARQEATGKSLKDLWFLLQLKKYGESELLSMHMKCGGRFKDEDFRREYFRRKTKHNKAQLDPK